MRTARYLELILCLVATPWLAAQEASSGADLRATLTAQAVGSNELTEAPRSEAPMAAGAHALLYPTIKFNENLFITGSLQFFTRPYYYSDLTTAGYGAKGNILQATLNYSRVSPKGSVLLRAGEMSTAFGSFLLRYDEAVNPLVDVPSEYGYYYALVSFLGVTGAQIDVTRGNSDGRIQFANSSPANPRSPFAHDQYGNWAGGGGYTVRQGLRVGASAYRGPYLDRQYKYFFPGEVSPNKLPAHAIGLDANWARGHTTAFAEVQRFTMPYTVIPTFRESAGYLELRQVVSSRWFVAGRYGLVSDKAVKHENAFETSAGFRVNRSQLIKFGYEFDHSATGSENNNTFGIQFITTLDQSLARSVAR